jgi:serine/threonine protein kinase
MGTSDAPTTGAFPQPSDDANEGTPSGYEVLELLGAGGMGVVLKALDRRLNRLVALKRVRIGGEKAERNRFRREAEAVARLQHPNIVQIFEVGELSGEPHLALEYVAGGSLA